MFLLLFNKIFIYYLFNFYFKYNRIEYKKIYIFFNNYLILKLEY